MGGGGVVVTTYMYGMTDVHILMNLERNHFCFYFYYLFKFQKRMHWGATCKYSKGNRLLSCKFEVNTYK